MTELHDITLAWEKIASTMQELQSSNLDRAWFEQWSKALEEFSDLVIVAMLQYRRDVVDKSSSERYDYIQTTLRPKMTLLDQALMKRAVKAEVDDSRLLRICERYKHELLTSALGNEALEAQERKLIKEQERLEATATVAIGEGLSLWGAMEAYQGEDDPDKRRELWLKIYDTFYALSPENEKIFLELVSLRTKLAQEAGFRNYLEYVARKADRNISLVAEGKVIDDTREAFAPVLGGGLAQEKEELARKSMRPWERRESGSVEVLGRLTEEAYVDIAFKSYVGLDEQFGEIINSMLEQGTCDLMVRKNKSTKNFSSILLGPNVPVVFANATGNIADVRVVLHEFGHAMHYKLGGQSGHGLFAERVAGADVLEFIAYALQGISIVNIEKLKILGEKELRLLKRATGKHVVETLRDFLPLEGLQQWVYKEAAERMLTPDEIERKWLTLLGEPGCDWSSFEHFRAKSWLDGQVIGRPLSNITYIFGIIGMLLVIDRFRQSPQSVMRSLLHIMKQGNAIGMPEALDVLDIQFPFSTEGCSRAYDVLILEYGTKLLLE